MNIGANSQVSHFQAMLHFRFMRNPVEMWETSSPRMQCSYVTLSLGFTRCLQDDKLDSADGGIRMKLICLNTECIDKEVRELDRLKH